MEISEQTEVSLTTDERQTHELAQHHQEDGHNEGGIVPASIPMRGGKGIKEKKQSNDTITDNEGHPTSVTFCVLRMF